ncbi:cation:proton antiporter [Streptomyces mobaraensis]|uniref:cation:proton antiporter n=1 Tax=Streptomyces mobaraensis TaxID=35621 RepID=UPI0033311F85
MTSQNIQWLFLDLALIFVLARALGAVAARVGQPPVVGEILAGVLLGPSLLGAAPAGRLFPTDVRPFLSALANIGVALFMFTVGLELEHRALRGRTRVTAGAALGSTLVPFALGLGLAFYLLRGHPHDQRTAFVVFVGLSVSVTAFPVLARILTDRGLARTDTGGLALATAAVVDVVAWSALAAVQAAVGGPGGQGHWRAALLLPFIAALVLLRPVLRRALGPAGPDGALTSRAFAVAVTGALLSSAATEAMGMHYIFGAFLFGAALPREGSDRIREELAGRTEQLTALLLPVYFVVAGLKVDLRGVGAQGIVELLAILAVAIGGKFCGTYLGARSQGLAGGPSATLAALMNTRGLTELVILGVGMELGLLDGPLYSLMVVMALVTTAMTGPLLSLIDRRERRRPRPPAQRVSGEAAAGRPLSGRAADA